MKKSFDFEDFQRRLKDLTTEPTQLGASRSVIDWFFKSDRYSFLQALYSYFLCRPLDPDAGVYFQHLDRPFGRLYVCACVGASLEAVNRKQHSPLLHFTCKVIRKVFKAFKVFDKLKSRVQKMTGKLGRNTDSDDYFYKCFEDEFRGSESSILESIETKYSPFIPYALGVERALDVGSGRGEMLRFLTTRGYKTTGVDINSFFVQDTLKQNLDVRKDDAIRFLKRQDSNSFSVVTALHFVEHIDFKELLKFFDECRRVLRPGGVIIIETPNARNLHVSSGDFYRDPTHRNPIFPDTLDFILKFYNFEGDCYFFGKDGTTYRASEHIFDNIKQYQIVSRDQAWIGRLP